MFRTFVGHVWLSKHDLCTPSCNLCTNPDGGYSPEVSLACHLAGRRFDGTTSTAGSALPSLQAYAARLQIYPREVKIALKENGATASPAKVSPAPSVSGFSGPA